MKKHHHTTPGGDRFLLTIRPADWSQGNQRRRDRISDFLTASAGVLGILVFLGILIFLSR